MRQSIPANDPVFNSHSSADSYQTVVNLPSRAYQLLEILLQDYEAKPLLGGVSQRLRQFYKQRFKCSWKTIQQDFNYLASLGLCISKPGGRGNAEKRWITYEGMTLLVNQASTYTSTYNHATPYIDLLEQEELDLKILEDTQICEYLNHKKEIEQETDIDKKLDLFLKTKIPAEDQREELKEAINRSQIGPVRKESVTNRVIAQNYKRPIYDISKYFLAAIKNEQKTISSIMGVFARSESSLARVNFY